MHASNLRRLLIYISSTKETSPEQKYQLNSTIVPFFQHFSRPTIRPDLVPLQLRRPIQKGFKFLEGTNPVSLPNVFLLVACRTDSCPLLCVFFLEELFLDGYVRRHMPSLGNRIPSKVLCIQSKVSKRYSSKCTIRTV